MIRKGFLAGAAAWLALTGVAVQAQSVLPKAPGGECVTNSEAEALALTLAPMAMREVVHFCAPRLPATAYFNHSEALLAKLQTASARAAPGARGAIAKLLGGHANDLSIELVIPAVDAAIAPMLTKALKAADCPTYDHIASLLDPLPAENTAELIIMIAQLAQRDKPDSKFPICPLPKAS